MADASPVVHTINVAMPDNIKLNCRFLNPNPDSSQPLLIVHHGAPGISSLAEPETSFKFLASKFRVLVFDARGSGESDLTGPFTHARWVADVEALRIWAGAEQFILAGGSYGGFIALDYALAHPGRLLGLILRDTAACGFWACMNALKQVLTHPHISPDADRQLRMWTGRTLSDEDLQAGFKEILGMYVAENDSSSKTTAENEGQMKFSPEAVSEPGKHRHFRAVTHNAVYSGELPAWDVRDRLGEIRVPTLVTVGRHDFVCPVSGSQEIAAGISRSKLVIFEHSGHSPPTEEPEAFQACVKQFLENLKF